MWTTSLAPSDATSEKVVSSPGRTWWRHLFHHVTLLSASAPKDPWQLAFLPRNATSLTGWRHGERQTSHDCCITWLTSEWSCWLTVFVTSQMHWLAVRTSEWKVTKCCWKVAKKSWANAEVKLLYNFNTRKVDSLPLSLGVGGVWKVMLQSWFSGMSNFKPQV